jgi:hypothetical protein
LLLVGPALLLLAAAAETGVGLMLVEFAGDALPDVDSEPDRSAGDEVADGDAESELGDTPVRTDGDAGIVEEDGLDALAGEAPLP